MDFLNADTDGYQRAGEALLATGVTAYLPTLITAPEEQLKTALEEIPAGTNGGRASSVFTSRARFSPGSGSASSLRAELRPSGRLGSW